VKILSIKINLNLDPKIYLGILILAVCVIGVSANSFQATKSQDTNSLLESAAQVNSFQKERQVDADNVYNVIQNMKNGDITAGKAHDYIFDERFYAKQKVDLNAVEIGVNKNYIAYCNTALDVVTAYSSFGKDSKEYQDSFKIMEEKKDLI
jgi:hypothetical protein